VPLGRKRQQRTPGWYPDPAGENVLRYWTGREWSEQTGPKIDPAEFRRLYPPPKRSTSLALAQVLRLMFGVVMLVYGIWRLTR
jgi:Protein of unknown function (DUF2510)